MTKLSDVIEAPISGEWGNEDKTGTGVPVLRTANFTNHGRIDFTNVVTREIKNLDEKLHKFLKPGDIIIEKSGGSPSQPVGRVVYFEAEENKYMINNFTSILRVKYLNQVQPKFLFYLLFHKYRRGDSIRFQNKTTGILNLQLDRYIEETFVHFPPLEVQKNIVQQLDSVYMLLSLRKGQLEELDRLIMSIFNEMFGDPSRNEKGWEVSSLASISKSGLSYGSGASATNYDGKTRYIRITDINDDGTLNNSVVSPDTIDERYLLNDGDILFARSGATVGKTLRYRAEFGRAIYAGYLIRLVPDQSRVSPDYIYYFTKTPYYNIFVERSKRTVAQPNINAQQYGGLKIILPPLSEQRKFASYASQIESQKSLVKQSIDETQRLFDSLMSKYFDD